MQLRGTRLCLDCEELHREDRCPVCGSDAFAYLTRWVTVEERRAKRREVAPPTPAPTPPPGLSRWVVRGAAGLVVVATGRWLWKSARPLQWSEPAARETRKPTTPDQDPPTEISTTDDRPETGESARLRAQSKAGARDAF